MKFVFLLNLLTNLRSKFLIIAECPWTHSQLPLSISILCFGGKLLNKFLFSYQFLSTKEGEFSSSYKFRMFIRVMQLFLWIPVCSFSLLHSSKDFYCATSTFIALRGLWLLVEWVSEMENGIKWKSFPFSCNQKSFQWDLHAKYFKNLNYYWNYQTSEGISMLSDL